MNGPIELVVTELSPGAARPLAEKLSRVGQVEVLAYASDGLEAAQKAIRLRPHVLLVHEDLPGINGLDVCRIVSLAAPEVACAVLAVRKTPELVEQAMAAGARAVIPAGIEPSELWSLLRDLAAIRTLSRTGEFQKATDPEKAPISIAVVAARGGVGRTVVAVNIACAIARAHTSDVVLAELVPQAADVTLLLGLQARAGIYDIIGPNGELDLHQLDLSVVHHSSGLKVLPGSSGNQAPALDILHIKTIARLAAHLRRRFQCTIWDLPPVLWSGGMYLLSRCERTLLVTRLDDAFVFRNTVALARSLLAGGMSHDALTIVVNAFHRSKAAQLDELRASVPNVNVAVLPSDERLIQDSIQRATPAVMIAPNSAFSHAIAELVEGLLRAPVSQAA